MGFMVARSTRYGRGKRSSKLHRQPRQRSCRSSSNVAPGRFRGPHAAGCTAAEAIVPASWDSWRFTASNSRRASSSKKNGRNSHAAFSTYRPAAGAPRLGSLFPRRNSNARELPTAPYTLYELPEIGALERLLAETPDLCGFNVTIPTNARSWRCSTTCRTMRGWSAVNCVRRMADSRLVGHNTDVIGLRAHLRLPARGRTALACPVLVRAGHRRPCSMLAERGIPFDLVSRDAAKGNYTYDNLPCEAVEQSRLIVNASPVGIYPAVDAAPRIPLRLPRPALPARPGIQPAPDPVPRPGAPARGAHTQRRGDVPPAAEASWRIWNE